MIKKIILFVTILILISGCATKLIVKKVPVLLEQKFTEGLVLKYKITEVMINTMVIQGTTQDQNISMGFTISNEIEKIVGDTIYINVSIDKSEGSVIVSGAMQPIPEVDELEGKVFKVVLLQYREVLSMESDLESDTKSMESNIKGYIQELFCLLPNKQVRVGDKWENDFIEDEYTTHSIYTLDGFQKDKSEKEYAIISVESEVSVNKIIDEEQVTVRVEISGKTKGKIICLLEDGFVSSAKLHAAMEGISYIEGSPMGNMEVLTYINQDVEIKRIR
ncbi:MAG: hypothetical protein KAW92_12935 [Candidatus Cloacimonetes bacterium]|nr:hypothetical protein [Candidatus Cloacimonadota bacterium]